MSQRHYLLNTSILSSDALELREAVLEYGAKVVEVAECVYQVPLPWMACFRQSDLRPCKVLMESDEVQTIQIPCVDLATAIQNLRAALPLFERLTGETDYAREFWEAAVEDIEKLPLPYLTMDLSEMLFMSTADDFNRDMTAALGRTNDAVDYFKGVFVAYYDEVQPYTLSEFRENHGITDDMRINNTIALDAAIECNRFVRDAGYYGS